MLTYAIGNGAAEEVVRQLACDNRGVFYKIPDGGDVMHIMSNYFLYFATGSRTCTVRWVEYPDWVTGEELLAGCLPFYSKPESEEKGKLKGVSCMDMNMVVPLETIKRASEYSKFQCMIEAVSRQCEALYLRDCDLAEMRAAVGSTCPGDSYCGSGDGSCVEPSCVDDITYKDSQGYFCDQWVGDDCTKAYPEWKDWGYTQADEDEILYRCPYSCMQCTRESDPAVCSAATCDGITGNVGCRERIVGGDGTVDEEEDMDSAIGTTLVAMLFTQLY
jgi:hypothetical protein